MAAKLCEDNVGYLEAKNRLIRTYGYESFRKNRKDVTYLMNFHKRETEPARRLNEWRNDVSRRLLLDERTDEKTPEDAFCSWLRYGGAEFDSLRVHTASDGSRSVVARRDVATGEAVLKVPRGFLITPEMGEATRLGQCARAAGLDDLNGNLYLALYILEDRHDRSSFFRPYYDILPSRASCGHFPVFWSDRELETLLRGSSFIEDVRAQRKENRDDYERMRECDPDLMSELVNDPEDFLWSELMVASRAFIVDSTKQTHAMVPFGDMLNTALPHTCDVEFAMEEAAFERDESAFVMRAVQDVRQDAQVTDSYGYKSTRRYLLHYGFAIERNETHEGHSPNTVRLPLCLRSSTFMAGGADKQAEADLLRRKAAIWTAEDDNGTSTTTERGMQISSPHVRRFMLIPEVVLSMMRLFVANSDEMDLIESRVRHRGVTSKTIGVVSYRNETAAHNHLTDVLEEQLRAYPTSIEEDRDALSNDEGNMTINQRNALIHVMGEKIVLNDWISVVKERSSLVQVEFMTGTANARAHVDVMPTSGTLLAVPPSPSKKTERVDSHVTTRSKKKNKKKKRKNKKR